MALHFPGPAWVSEDLGGGDHNAGRYKHCHGVAPEAARRQDWMEKWCSASWRWCWRRVLALEAPRALPQKEGRVCLSVPSAPLCPLAHIQGGQAGSDQQ